MENPFPDLSRYVGEFPRRDFESYLQEQIERVSDPVASTLSGANVEQASHIYGLTRLMSEWSGYVNVVETGTANGVFSLSILLGISHSPYPGSLYTIGLPFRKGEDIEDHRKKTWSGFKGARTPKQKPPGWFATENPFFDLHNLGSSPPSLHRFEGLVQSQLPHIFCLDNPDPNLWVFDSGHDAPTQTFELEFSFHHGRKDAVIFMDDRAFDGTDAVSPVAEKYGAHIHGDTPGIAATLRKQP